MEQKELRGWEAQCIQDEPPLCQAGCPLNIDCRAFVQAMGNSDTDSARSILEKTMPIAGIVARLCEAPCESFCLRKNFGGSIAIGALEKVCVETAAPRRKFFRVPSRPKKVLIIGGGPSSLCVSFDLAKKGYPVSIYYGGRHPGGRLTEVDQTILPESVLEEELAFLKKLGASFYPLKDLTPSLIEGADSIYVGQDDIIPAPISEKCKAPDLKTSAVEHIGWFTGGMSGENDRYRLINDISQGRQAGISIDRYLQGASLTADRKPVRNGKTNLYTRTDDIVPVRKTDPATPGHYTIEEAVLEAKRCINCQCLECVKNCEYLKQFKEYPKVYARQIYNNSAIVQGTHLANSLINSCALCSLCETVCPNDFSMASLCHQARQAMVEEERMPPSAHWFGLAEMRSAQAQAALVRHAAGTEKSERIFFPGCQLAGIRPDQCLQLYDTLVQQNPLTGIWLSCCAAPAYWAGRTDEFSELTTTMRRHWQDMGEPQVVTACSTCLKIFRDHLPEIKVVSVWSVLDPVHLKLEAEEVFALSDPCTSRDDKQTQDTVRALLKTLGQELTPLAHSGVLTECCGFGGLMESSNPELARDVAARRVAQTDSTILTYCAMCRDQLSRTGKPVAHILDLLFPATKHSATEPPVTLSGRRENRRFLKEKLLSRYNEELPQEPWETIELELSPPVIRLMEERRILAEDLKHVLHNSAKRGMFFRHNTTGSCIANCRLGEVMFWLEYLEEDGIYRIERCWSHRMNIGGAAE